LFINYIYNDKEAECELINRAKLEIISIPISRCTSKAGEIRKLKQILNRMADTAGCGIINFNPIHELFSRIHRISGPEFCARSFHICRKYLQSGQ